MNEHAGGFFTSMTDHQKARIGKNVQKALIHHKLMANFVSSTEYSDGLSPDILLESNVANAQQSTRLDLRVLRQSMVIFSCGGHVHPLLDIGGFFSTNASKPRLKLLARYANVSARLAV